MDGSPARPRLGPVGFSAVVLLLGAVGRLYHIGSPMADSLEVKQIYVANKARSIARAPLAPLRNSLDFLNDRGERMELTEEVPVYVTLLALGYRLLGESDWVGHALSLCGALVSLIAFYDLMRREFEETTARAATLLFASCPLLIFYGRAVLPDPWMLACMLASAACWRRRLDGGRTAWLAGAALFGLLAVLFKYYGLILLVPLAEMAYRRRGWRIGFDRGFCLLALAMTVPTAIWILVVFDRSPNPIRSGWTSGPVLPYTIFQAPRSLLRWDLYGSMFSRFLSRDCGPITALLMVLGAVLAMRRKMRSGPLWGWSVMGLAFYFIFAPKVIDHDYYELMMLPAAAGWGGLGWRAVVGREWWGISSLRIRGSMLGSGFVVMAILVQSPWVMNSLFRIERGKLAVAVRLKELCPVTGRFVAMGPGIGFPVVVHYSGREGWAIHNKELPSTWREELVRRQSQGARLVALYFEARATAAQRLSYKPLLDSLPLVEHRSGPWSRTGETCEYYILRLSAIDLQREPSAPRNLAARSLARDADRGGPGPAR